MRDTCPAAVSTLPKTSPHGLPRREKKTLSPTCILEQPPPASATCTLLSPHGLYIFSSLPYVSSFKFQVPTSLLSSEPRVNCQWYTAQSNQSTPFRMSSSDLQLPPGFRFHPTDEELVKHYLCRKCQSQPISVPIIAEIDLYKYNPWDLPGNFSPSKIRFWN